MPLVSIVLPTYNRPKLLRRTLNCSMMQTFNDFEIIVVNDAGEDVSEIVAQYPKASNIQRLNNGGLSAARNTGMEQASGKYITYWDDDDIFFPEHLAVLVEHLEMLPHIRAAYTDCYRWYQEHWLASARPKESTGKKPNICAIICLMHERECLDKIGYFDTSLREMEDWDFIYRMQAYYQVLHIQQYTAAYSKRFDGSQLTDDEERMKAAAIEVRNRHGRPVPKYARRLALA